MRDRRSPPLMRPSHTTLVAVTIWVVGPVACLWVNESALVFQARRSRVPPPLRGSGLLELRTNDGVRLNALLLPLPARRSTGSCSAAERPDHPRLRAASPGVTSRGGIQRFCVRLPRSIVRDCRFSEPKAGAVEI